jgi:hypothetical protein
VIGAAVSAWPAVALVGSYELLMMVIRSSQAPADNSSEGACNADALQEQAVELFAEHPDGLFAGIRERFLIRVSILPGSGCLHGF